MSATLFVGQRLSGFVFLMLAAGFVAVFPVAQIWLAAGYACYAFLLMKYPRIWLIAVPVAMPAFDLAFFSGWFFFDEFDALVLVTLAVLFWRCPLRREDFHLGWPLAVVIGLLCLSYGASAALPLIPWPAIDGNSFASYYSPFNALRVAKGFLWPLLLLPHLNQALRNYSGAGRLFAFGLVASLFAMALIGLYEHWLFVGLFNFGHEYRIIGPFSSMHTGDGHIDLWLATAIPVIAAIFVDRWPPLVRLCALGVAGLAFYILVATASRGPFLATAAALFVLICAFVLVWIRRGKVLRTALLVPMLLFLGSIALVPFVVPTELGARFQLVERDAQARLDHFREALDFRTAGVRTKAIGMGLGTFPAVYESRRAHFHRLARYSFDGPPGGRYLTLRSGDNLYVSQKIDAQPDTPYLLSFDYRTRDRKYQVTVAICEKWLIHSGICSWHTFRLQPTGGEWRSFSKMIKAKDVGKPHGRIGSLSSRPIRLSLHTAGAATGVSLDNISLVATDGRNLVRNGNFNRTNDHWFWTVDNHLPWHTKNFAVNVLFDQGWFGLVSLCFLVTLALVGLIRAICQGYSDAVPWLGALAGYLVNGFVVSPFDQPRLAMLFYLICFFTVLRYLHHRLASAE